MVNYSGLNKTGRLAGWLLRQANVLLKKTVQQVAPYITYLDKPPLWSDRWAPMILDRDEQDNWYMVVAPIHCHDWNSNFPYRQYKVINDAWQQVDFDMRLDKRRPNIEWYIRLKEMPPKLYLIDKPEWEKGGGIGFLVNTALLRPNTASAVK